MIPIESLGANLSRGEDGIWYGEGHEAVSYPEEGSAACFDVEDDSFWFAHRNRCIVSIVGAFAPPRGEPICDIGGGNGFVSQGLARAGHEVVIVEPRPVGARNARARGLEHVICASTETAGFRPQSLSAVGLFDVIEHLGDDLAFLGALRELLRPTGLMYLTVPSHPFLWSGEDAAAGHFRRYAAHELETKLEQAGFRVAFSSGIFRFLLVPIFLVRALPWKLGFRPDQQGLPGLARDHLVPAGPRAAAVNALAGFELANLDGLRPMRLGASRLVVAERL